jgi:hypothetical protein
MSIIIIIMTEDGDKGKMSSMFNRCLKDRSTCDDKKMFCYLKSRVLHGLSSGIKSQTANSISSLSSAHYKKRKMRSGQMLV